MTLAAIQGTHTDLGNLGTHSRPKYGDTIPIQKTELGHVPVFRGMSPNFRVVYASGGSGGHLYPGLAIAQAIQEKVSGASALFLISEKPVESGILSQSPYPFHVIASCPPKRGQLGTFVRKFWEGYRKSAGLLRQFKPHALVALGGFACLAPALAARRLGIPLFVQEQNCLAGRASAFLSFFAKGVFVPFPGMEKQFPFVRVLATGNPVRRAAFAQDKQASRRRLGLAPDKFTVLVLGGSQGAKFLNNLVSQSLDRLSDLKGSLQWVHMAGAEDAQWVKKAFADKGWTAAVSSFMDRMGICYGASDLVVSRAGATTVAELIANAMASVLIPIPGALRDHQKKNAQVLSSKGAAYLLDQEQLAPSAFATILRGLQRDPARVERMKTGVHKLLRGNAAEAIADALVKQVSG